MNSMFYPRRSGQSLMEVLIGIAVGSLLIISAASLIAPALKSNISVTEIQTSAALGKELLDNVRSFTEGNWHNISVLATSSANKYYLNATSSPFTAATGTQSISATTTYTRYFYLDDAYRDGSGNIAGSGTYDPSTRKVTVVFGWSGGPTSTMSTYVVRGFDSVARQTDWSAGPVQSGTVVTSFGSGFATSVNANYSTTTGSIQINSL